MDFQINDRKTESAEASFTLYESEKESTILNICESYIFSLSYYLTKNCSNILDCFLMK